MKLRFHLLLSKSNSFAISPYHHRVNLTVGKVCTKICVKISIKYSIVTSNGRTNKFALFRLRGGAL